MVVAVMLGGVGEGGYGDVGRGRRPISRGGGPFVI